MTKTDENMSRNIFETQAPGPFSKLIIHLNYPIPIKKTWNVYDTKTIKVFDAR